MRDAFKIFIEHPCSAVIYIQTHIPAQAWRVTTTDWHGRKTACWRGTVLKYLYTHTQTRMTYIRIFLKSRGRYKSNCCWQWLSPRVYNFTKILNFNLSTKNIIKQFLWKGIDYLWQKYVGDFICSLFLINRWNSSNISQPPAVDVWSDICMKFFSTKEGPNLAAIRS